jgi:hypothetical protein
MNTFTSPTLAIYFMVCILSIPICTIAVALRFQATRNVLRKIGLEDWFCLGSLIAFYGDVIVSLVALEILDGRELDNLQPWEDTAILKIVYAGAIFFPVNQFFAKFSILLLYYRIFSIHKSFVISVYVLGAIQAGISIAYLIVSIFECTPVSYFWEPEQEGTCIDLRSFTAAAEAINSAHDFLMVSLAVVMLWGVKTNSIKKWKISLVFILGSLAGVIGFIKVGTVLASTDYNRALVAFLTLLQAAFSTLCCCFPLYKNIVSRITRPRWFHRVQLWSKLGSLYGTSVYDTSRPIQGGSYGDQQEPDWVHSDVASTRAFALGVVPPASTESPKATVPIRAVHTTNT